MFALLHDGEVLPGNLTLWEVFELDEDQDCKFRS